MERVYNKDEFARRMAKKGYTIKACNQVVDDMLETISEILIEGDSIKFRGFGAFEVREHKERSSVSPITRERIVIPPYNVVHFAAGTLLKSRVKGEDIME